MYAIATMEEAKLIQDRFSRIYPNERELTYTEATLFVVTLKSAGQWWQLQKEEEQFKSIGPKIG